MKQLLLLLLALLLLLSSCADGQAQGSDPLSSAIPSEPESTTESRDTVEETTADTDDETTDEITEDMPTWDTEVETEPETEPDSDDTDEEETEVETEDNGETEWVEPPYYEVDGYMYRIDVSQYLAYIAPKKPEEYLILANRNHELSSSYTPSDLVRTKTNYDKKLRKAAAYALDAMFLEMKALGVCDTIPQSAYRSYATQVRIYNSYLEKERKKHPTYTEEQIIALVQTYSSPPGASDHQTGLAVDFHPIGSSFSKTQAFRYLKKNAHKFGFILRFPDGMTDITGYKYESWHWRFVGREAATKIYERGLTLEEYLEELYGGIIPPETSVPESGDTETPETSIPESDDIETDVPETDTSESGESESDAPDTSLPDDTDIEPLPDDSTEGEIPPDTDSQPPETDSQPPETDGVESSSDFSDAGSELLYESDASSVNPSETTFNDGGEDVAPPDPESNVPNEAATTQATPSGDANTADIS